MDAALLEKLVGHGVLGVVCALQFYWIVRLTKELGELRAACAKELAEARAEAALDAAKYTSKLLEVADRVHVSTDRLADTADKLVDLGRENAINRARGGGGSR